MAQNDVFVVHGRDDRLRTDFFSFLRALNINPIEWSEAIKQTGKAAPYIGEILESAFQRAQAVIVLLSPDDEVRLSPHLCAPSETEKEKEYQLQARPNVLFEAGMAFGVHPDKTLLIEVGQVKAFSDVIGRHVVKLSNEAEKRKAIADRLITAGCAVSMTGDDWLKIGDFTIERSINKDVSSASSTHRIDDLSKGDIIALLEGWWPKGNKRVPDNVSVRFSDIDDSLSLPNGSTKQFIDQIARRKSFKCVSGGNLFAEYEYDPYLSDIDMGDIISG